MHHATTEATTGAPERGRGVRLLTGLLVALAIVGGAASAAGAQTGYVGGGTPTSFTYSYNPEQKLIDVNCNSYTASILIQPKTAVQRGFLGGQWVTYRYQVRNRATGWWSQSGWAAATWLAGSSPNAQYMLGNLPASTYRPGIHADWEVLVQVGYWNTGQWHYSTWNAPTGGSSLGGSDSKVHCYT